MSLYNRADPRHVGATDRPLIGARGKLVVGRPSEPILFKIFRLRTGLADILKARTQITDNFRSKSFAWGNLNLPAPYLWLFQGRRSAPHRLTPRAAARLSRPLGRPCYISNYKWQAPVCYPVTVISLMNSDVLLRILVSAVDLAVLTKVCRVFIYSTRLA